MTRYALGIQYDGREWLGWQSQPGGRTVQDGLEAALSKFADAPVRTICAGRTDAGVHAIGQVVHFDTTAVRESNGWIRGTNALLPASIAVNWVVPVANEFHARFSALARTYRYVLYNHAVRSPHAAGRAGWFHQPLDAERMREGATHLLGCHDFSAFRSSECQAKSPIKTLARLEITQRGAWFVFTLQADAFLHHMVRNILGALIMVGKGKMPPGWIAEILAGRDRTKAAPTFMADGLYLETIEYPEHFGIPASPGLDAVFPGLR